MKIAGKSIQLVGAAYLQAEKIHKANQEIIEFRQELNRDFEEKLNNFTDERLGTINLAFASLSNHLGLEESEVKNMRLDTGYIDEHGLAFLVSLKNICPDCGLEACGQDGDQVGGTD